MYLLHSQLKSCRTCGKVHDCSPEPGRISIGDLLIDRELRDAFAAGKPLGLRQSEFALLLFLARAGGAVLTRGAILDALESNADERAVDIAIFRLRRAIDRALRPGSGRAYIVAVFCRGYRIQNPKRAAVLQQKHVSRARL